MPSSGAHLGSASLPCCGGDGLLQVRQVAASGIQRRPRLRRCSLRRHQQGRAHPRSRHLLRQCIIRAGIMCLHSYGFEIRALLLAWVAKWHEQLKMFENSFR